ncbi:Nuclear pore complex protein Nup98-Nup96 [Halotydeus destructor]|nr:Nuclear pore complex protein Nup98-Nup96 [Halotydeus destructor]
MQTQVDFTIPVDRENELQNKKMAQFAPYSPATTYTVFDPMDYSQSYFPSSGTEPLEGLEALADMKKQYNPFDEMRNLFFAEDEEEDREEASLNRSLFKKSRHLYSRPSATDLQFISENRPAAAIDIPTVSRKREMTFKTNAAISENKAIIDISSIKCAPCPRVGFSRGSACLITYSGSKVNIMAVKLIPDVSKEEGRLQEQMDKLTDVITHSSVQPVAQVRPKISNSRNIQSHENLVVALYGDKLQSTDYGKEEERINATIDWLCERNKLYKLPVNCLDRIIYHLSVNDVKMAVDEALKGRQPRLATLIACGTCNTTKDALVLQLDSWKQSKADEHIDQSLLRLYLLLSGGVHWRLSSGSEIFAVEGLEWSQQLALLLLYGTHDGLSDCVKHVRTNTNDVEYHLISGDSHWVTLSACANELEAWFLHQSLVGYGALSTSDALSDVVHGNLVAQMMSESPKWSSFIACHITDDELRDFAVKEILNHGVMHLSDNDLIWIEKNLLIDKKIISSATSLFKKSQVSPLSKPLGLSSFDLTALGLDVVLAAS